MPRRPPARWPIAVVALGLIGIAGIGLVPGWIEGDPQPQGIGTPPASYTAVYRVEDADGVVTTERLWVRRPFEARFEVWRGAPPGDERLSVAVTRFGLRETVATGSSPAVLSADPGVLEGDVRGDVLLGRGALAFTGDHRTVLDVRCDVYREQRDDTTIEYCLDRRGLALEEHRRGETVDRRRVAISLQTDASIGDERFEIGAAPSVDLGTGAVARLTDDSLAPGATSYLFGDSPAGFQHFGRFVYSPPSLPEGASVPGAEFEGSEIVASVLDVWTAGADFVLVENGGTLSTRDAFDREEGRQVVIEGLGPGQMVRSGATNEVRVLLDEGRYVRVRGTVSSARLVELARSLEPVPGTTLTTVPPS